MSELQQYIESQSADGKVDSEGEFTLDLARAADKLAAFALPSHSHFLLKFVQVAHHLRASEVKITIERFRSVIRFRAPSGGSIIDSEAIYRAFADPLTIEEPLMQDFISGLIGTITKDNLETLWSFSEGHNGRRMFIDRDRRFSIQSFVLSRPLEPDVHPCSFTLSVLHPRTWKFWKSARRRAEATRILDEHTRFSGVNVVLDNRLLPVEPVSSLNQHRSALRYRDGFSYTFRPAADTILFQMSDGSGLPCGLIRPSLSAYVVRNTDMNLWLSSIRVNNRLTPGGDESPAWVIQFRKNGENLSIRHAPKRVLCRAVLSINRNNNGAEEPLQLRIVRGGVLVLHESMDGHQERLKAFNGCSLLFCDEQLETDLTGFQVIQNEAFLERILSFEPMLVDALKYLERAKPLLEGYTS